jgi:hypothetical protein
MSPYSTIIWRSPGIGFLDVNAFLLHAREPVVIDTGLGLPDRDFVSDLSHVIDPSHVRWIWLTHPDRDHTGGLFSLLDAAPQARVVTTYIGVGIMSAERPIPLDRVHLLNAGQSLDVGDRTLVGLRPPLFDNPATVGVYDDRSRTFFSSDCFGAPVSTAAYATGTDVADIPDDELRDGQLLWASIDSPCTYRRRWEERPHSSTRSPPRPGPARSSAPTRPPSKRCWLASSQCPPGPNGAPVGDAALPAFIHIAHTLTRTR